MDLIDREQAIAEMHLAFGAKPAVHAQVVNVLNGLPSAEKTGKWIEGEIVPDKESVPDWQQAQCSVCGKWHITPYLHSFHYYNYCPECGARMEAPHEK